MPIFKEKTSKNIVISKKKSVTLDSKHNEILKMNSKDLKKVNEEYLKITEAYTVTSADKKGNTKAYQNFKSGMKNAITGKPLYKAADHLKKEELEATGQFSAEEIEKIIACDQDD